MRLAKDSVFQQLGVSVAQRTGWLALGPIPPPPHNPPGSGASRPTTSTSCSPAGVAALASRPPAVAVAPRLGQPPSCRARPRAPLPLPLGARPRPTRSGRRGSCFLLLGGRGHLPRDLAATAPPPPPGWARAPPPSLPIPPPPGRARHPCTRSGRRGRYRIPSGHDLLLFVGEVLLPRL
jgi:hypothetical protein